MLSTKRKHLNIGAVMNENIGKDGDARGELAKRFWDTQFKHKCFYNCDICVNRKQAIDAAKQSKTLAELQSTPPNTETCNVVATYSTPHWWNPFVGRFTIMIVSDKGHHEFTKVCKSNIGNLFK